MKGTYLGNGVSSYQALLTHWTNQSMVRESKAMTTLLNGSDFGLTQEWRGAGVGVMVASNARVALRIERVETGTENDFYVWRVSVKNVRPTRVLGMGRNWGRVAAMKNAERVAKDYE